MSLKLFGVWTRRTNRPTIPRPPAQHYFRPRLEGFEDRVVPAAPVLGAAQAAPINVSPTFNLNVLNLNVSDIQVLSNNTLGAVVNVGNVTQIIPITLSTSPNPNGDCPILHLALGPINLDLLGLNVDTSQICLDITAHQGEGLLGDLLCGVSHLLDGGTSLGDILGGLTSINPGSLTGALQNVLNGVLGGLGNANVLGVGGTTPGATDILNLSVGPLDLNLLGLEVQLDDCNGGPVTVDITAESGPGKLLGNLLTGLSHLLDNPAGGGGGVGNLLGKIETQIGRIVGSVL